MCYKTTNKMPALLTEFQEARSTNPRAGTLLGWCGCGRGHLSSASSWKSKFHLTTTINYTSNSSKAN